MYKANLFTKFVDILVKISREGLENSGGEKAVLVPARCIQVNCQVPQLLGPVCFPIRCDQSVQFFVRLSWRNVSLHKNGRQYRYNFVNIAEKIRKIGVFWKNRNK